MRRELVLGATSWINNHVREAHDLGIDAPDFSSGWGAISEQTVKDFCSGAKLNIKELIQLGRDAIDRGCVPDMTEKPYQIRDEEPITILRGVKPGWDDIDGTVERSADDDAGRYGLGPKNTNNSCHTDATLFCAIMLDAGRIQVDQIPLDVQKRLPKPARILRQIVALQWTKVDPDERNQLRDLLRNALQATNPNRFRTRNMADVVEVLQECLFGLPQLSFTFVRVGVCCDGELMPPSGCRAERELGFHLLQHTGKGPLSLADRVGLILNEPTPSDDKSPCSNGKECMRIRSRQRVILDRMPPTLMLWMPVPISKANNREWKLFEDFEAPHRTTRGEKTDRYSPIGCIVWHEGIHYVVRWKGKGETEGKIVEHDGLKTQRVKEVKGWWDELPKAIVRNGLNSTGVVVMFYRRA